VSESLSSLLAYFGATMSADETPTGTEPTTDVTRTWPELAESLYERLTGRGAEISYEFENMSVDVPSHAGEDAAHANWRLDGTLRIRTRDHGRRGTREQP
jgi:hypothetical protein